MSNNSSSSSSGAVYTGIFVALLSVLFIGLKLTGYIDWSWVWVLSPLWITAGIVALLILAFAVVVAVVSK